MPEPAMTQRDATNLTQSLRDLTNEVRGLRGEIADTYVRKDVLAPQLDGIRATLAAHSGWFTWAGRIVVGLVIVALVTLVLSGGVPHAA